MRKLWKYNNQDLVWTKSYPNNAEVVEQWISKYKNVTFVVEKIESNYFYLLKIVFFILMILMSFGLVLMFLKLENFYDFETGKFNAYKTTKCNNGQVRKENKYYNIKNFRKASYLAIEKYLNHEKHNKYFESSDEDGLGSLILFFILFTLVWWLGGKEFGIISELALFFRQVYLIFFSIFMIVCTLFFPAFRGVDYE